MLMGERHGRRRGFFAALATERNFMTFWGCEASSLTSFLPSPAAFFMRRRRQTSGRIQYF
jgi:hypothetical protein